MNFEKPKIEGPLSEDEARDEANMIKAKLKHDEEPWGKWGKQEFTAQDYEKAEAFIDNLKAELEAEPELTKNLEKLGRIGLKAATVVGYPVALASEFMEMFFGQFTGESRFDRRAEQGKNGWNGMVASKLSEARQMLKEKLEDPAKKMQLMKKLGEKYEKDTKKQNEKEKIEEIENKLKKAA